MDSTGKLTATQAPSVTFASLTGKPTTLAGYGITDGGASGAVIRGQDIPWLTPVSGESMMTTLISTGGTGILACTANQIRLSPFTPRVDTPITRLSFIVTTEAAGATGKIVIYRSDANGRPGALMLETAAVDLSTARTKSVAASQTLLKGQTYWLGLRSNAAPTIVTWDAGATPDINGGPPAPLHAKR